MGTLQLQVRKDRLETTRTVDLPDVALSDGQARVRVAHFAYTADNITCTADNITCTAFGEAMA